MTQRTLALISAIVLIVLAAGGILYVKLHPAQLQNASTAPLNAPLAVGVKAPLFTLPTTAGPFDLATVTKPVLIEIFATWCPHCQRETAVMNELFAAYGKRVAFISIPGSPFGMDGTSPASQADVLNFMIKFTVKYPVAAFDPNLTVARQYLKGGYPTIAIVDRNKHIAFIDSGEIPYRGLAPELDKVLH
ncbi:MAG TPA: TlpA disulfide reductase family protein [Candidatus Aquilonibacter sp.]